MLPAPLGRDRKQDEHTRARQDCNSLLESRRDRIVPRGLPQRFPNHAPPGIPKGFDKPAQGWQRSAQDRCLPWVLTSLFHNPARGWIWEDLRQLLAVAWSHFQRPPNMLTPVGTVHCPRSIPHIPLVVLHLVPSQKLAQLILKRGFAMMFLLPRNVRCDCRDLRKSHREYSITTLPGESREI